MTYCLTIAEWKRHQPRGDQPTWIKLQTNLLYDANFLSLPDAAQLIFIKLCLAAAPRHGTIPLTADDEEAAYNLSTRCVQSRYTLRTKRYIKLLVDKGLVILTCTATESRARPRVQGHLEALDLVLDPAVAVSSGELMLLRRPTHKKRASGVEGIAPRKARAKATPPERGPPTPSWLAPYCAAWEAENGTGSFAPVAGQCAKALRVLDVAHGSGRVAANLARYLAETPARFQSPGRFAATFGAWGGEPDGIERALVVMRRYGGPVQTPREAWEEFDEATRAAIKRAGGLAAIWGGAGGGGPTGNGNGKGHWGSRNT